MLQNISLLIKESHWEFSMLKQKQKYNVDSVEMQNHSIDGLYFEIQMLTIRMVRDGR